MYNPGSTYRIQFHKDFSLQTFEAIIPYLKKLGIRSVYASPVFAATPGSMHGYDTWDANRINPEIGSIQQLREVIQKLKEEHIGWVQDIVPNHMAYDPGNPWIFDFLEKGPRSRHAAYFDTWDHISGGNRIMVPFLGQDLKTAIDHQDLKLALQNGRFVFTYYDVAYPLHPRSYITILSKQDSRQSIKQLLEQLEKIQSINDSSLFTEQWNQFLEQLNESVKNKLVQQHIDEVLDKCNNDPSLLYNIHEEQCYRLCHWQETDQYINYRRFFTVNGLICLNIQRAEVLNDHHTLIRCFVEEGLFDGLRIDHIDGLYDPSRYLQQLRELTSKETYIVVEKILEPGEVLPIDWPVQGTSGYDFLSLVNNLLTQKNNEPAFTSFYRELANNDKAIEEQIRQKKAGILYQHMRGELDNLFQLFMRSNLLAENEYSQMRTEDIKTVIAEFLIHCPVYRFYGNSFPFDQEEVIALELVFDKIKSHRPDLSAASDLLYNVLLVKPITEPEEYKKKALHFYQRCMQITGPLMAKGVEDTLMYTYHRFIGHNEVGDAPGAFGITASAFHTAMKKRQKHWPLALNATSTHDTKKGEDVRARLNVLSEMPQEWFTIIKEWQLLNFSLKQNNIPGAADEYFIYQVLTGSYPLPGEETEIYPERLTAYLQKALREAKQHSNWTNPNEEYENATIQFAIKLLDRRRPFWKSFQDFQQKIIDHGILNSFAQTILKFTCPGVPDVYQGCELWDFSFVDPDNRRPVDYKKRDTLLQDLQDHFNTENLFSKLWQKRYNAQIKLWLTHKLLQLRESEQLLFSRGEYFPLETKGIYSENVFAFARKQHRSWCIIAIPLHTVSLCQLQQKEINEIDWENTKLILPKGLDIVWENLLDNKKDSFGEHIEVSQLFQHQPFAILKGKQSSERGAGILLHITSLPSPFAIGDMGPEAYKFIDLLYRSNQTWWQILPLNPTESGQGHSPYSSVSCFAGNPFLISPQLLVKEGLLQQKDINGYYQNPSDEVDFKKAEEIKTELLITAFKNYKQRNPSLKKAFVEFREKESSWLNDYALYVVLKKQYDGKPWYQWEDKHKLHNKKILGELEMNKADELEFICWIQFIFFHQWSELKKYGHKWGIHLIGDLPIYVSYDSADVWSQREIFALDENGNPTGLAGVPPDAFSEDGQLWGMPVYNWEILKKRNFDWWILRLKKNLELYELIRLDHFRAFADYWEIPSDAESAKKGTWKKGPGAALFEAMQKALGTLPLIAEDLGEINEAVYHLRDRFEFPGMKVLQFAFDENISQSEHSAHNHSGNFVVYTGTHDNNTILGWYNHEADTDTKRRIQEYAGIEINSDNVVTWLNRLAYASVANLAILPLQDILALDETTRMNKPSTIENNWSWRLLPGQVTTETEDRLAQWTWLYNR
ncbi:MAG TPA: malto-oligosyltrehalose synthase [Flavisolibacter sp.]|nr:malto-oligosyltrehalose synthase [Flavisolibacter sp.]